MAISPSGLGSEILNDPLGLGYAPHVSGGADSLIAGLLNELREGCTARETTLTPGEFQLAALPGLLAIDGLADAATKAKWERILGIVRSTAEIPLENPGVLALLAGAVADGLMTSEQADAIGFRTSSRAEQLWGAGTYVSDLEVALALRG